MPDTTNSLNSQRAAFWRVDLRTIQRWLARTPPLPVDDPAAMLAWVASQSSIIQAKLSPAFRRRIDELRLEAERAALRAPATAAPPSLPSTSTSSSVSPGFSPAAPPGAPAAASSSGLAIQDPDRAAFLAARQEAAAAPGAEGRSHDAAYLAALKLERDFAIFKLQRANAANNLPVIKDTTEAITRLSGVIHDEELRAQRLGREIGDIIPRADYQRQIKAIAYWLVRCVDHAKATLAPRLAAASATGPLFRQEVDAILEPVLLTAFVLEPLRRAADLPAGTGAALPPWALTTLRTAHAAVLEDPAAPAPPP